ncbi:3-keto-5-aminohexanoate cleavage protein [Rhodocytophaga rosea]|uniref:3-keto-5-aminohexanoate cleavage protein n=1 Tax=Rhodocytophaga rosea TaxID=2704465 RepID=A0A6C0GBA6_9BACT|nr:3-keto-5-aminohexanoate cleavage protein [Rhodocytophaga rosea]QHT65177.1 3-keto-5-aminohexanoate cleavage protein [Rhodocytophaga rosea]
MAKPFSSRISKLNQLKKRLRIDNQKLLSYIDSPLSVHQLELILGAEDTIYLTQENVELLEKAMQIALAANQPPANPA